MTKRLPIPSLLILLSTLFVDASALASLKDEIRALYHPMRSAMPVAETKSTPEKRFRLKNGREVVTSQWRIILFMQGGCVYCQQFDPLLNPLSQKTGIKVFPYTLDGKGDPSFPDAFPAPPEVLKTFFAQLPVVTPTTFLLNVHTLKTWPILQGATDEQQFITQLNAVFHLALRGKTAHAD